MEWLAFLLLLTAIFAGLAVLLHFKQQEIKKKKAAAPEINKKQNLEDAGQKEIKELKYCHTLQIEKAKSEWLENNAPVMTFRVNKVGHSDNYHSYFEEADVGEIVDVDHSYQFNCDTGRERDCFTVTGKWGEIGEVSNVTVEKIGEIYDYFYAVTKVDDSNDPPRITIGVYEMPYRGTGFSIVGIQYDNRRDHVLALESGTPVKIIASEFEGNPAVEIRDPFDNLLGFMSKDLAEEFCNRINRKEILRTWIGRIEEKDDGEVLAVVFMYIQKR